MLLYELILHLAARPGGVSTNEVAVKHPYTRQQAAYPAPWVREHKFWPPVGRVDNVHGDRNLICTCPSIEEYAEA